MHSLITPVPRNVKTGWYKTFRNHAYLAINSQKCRVLLIGDSIIANFSKFSPIFDKHFSKFHPLNFGIGGDKIQNVLWRIINMSFPLSLQYIFIHCGTNNIGHNDPEVISDGLINLARVIKKKYKDVKIIISSLLPRDKANSQKRSLVIATNIYLKEACNVNSFSFVELDSGWIVGSSLNMLLFKNDHLHLTKFGYEKLSSLFVSQLNLVLEKTHETPQEPQLAHSNKSPISFTLNKEEFSSLLSVCSPLGSLTVQLNQVCAYEKVLINLFSPLVRPIFIILCQVENQILGLK